jgi:hypothetical protein
MVVVQWPGDAHECGGGVQRWWYYNFSIQKAIVCYNED